MCWTVLLYIIFLNFAQAENNNNEITTVIVTELGPLKVGEDLPSFNGQTSVGGRLSSRSVIGQEKVLIVSYAATWCQPCRYGIPIIERVVQTDDSVQAVYIALDTEIVKVQKWAEDIGIRSSIVVDRFNAIAKRHGVIIEDQPREIPITIVVDGRGNISQIFTTEGSDFEIKLREAIESATQKSIESERFKLHDPESIPDEQGSKQ